MRRSLFALIFVLASTPWQIISSRALAAAKTCCNVQTGDWVSTSSATACTTMPGHVALLTEGSPQDRAKNMQQVMVCMQKTQQRAMEYQGIPGMGGGQVAAKSSEDEIADCCHVQSASWLGSMEVSECLAEDGQYPDTDAYQGQVGVCNSPGGGGGGASADDIVINIPNGGFESWTGDEPTGFMNFDGGNQAAQATAQAGMDMQAVLKSADSHTGAYSLHLKAKQMELPPEAAKYVPTDMLPIIAGGVTSCGDNCAALSGGQPMGDSAALSIPVNDDDPGYYLCGVYKGRFVGGDQLWVNATVHAGGQVAGGTNSGARAMNFISKNAGNWTGFKMPITMLPGYTQTPFTRASIELTLQPAGGLRALTMGQVIKVHPGTEVKIDSLRFCGEVGITLYNPEVTDGRKIDNSKELTTGAQTFVNLDNDDKNDSFDFEDVAMSEDDDELVKMVLSMPVREHGFIQFLKTTADDGAIRVWEDARKETEFTGFTENDDKLVIPAFLEEEDGEWRKELWVEGLKPSQSQKDTRFEFVYTQKETQKREEGESDEVAITVIGIEKVEWKGQENGPEESDDLDEEPNWARLAISGEPGGKMLRVFPGKKAVGGKPGNRARDRVKLKVKLSVEPVEPIDIYFRAYDVDDPTSDKNPIDDESADADNRGTSPSPTGRFPLSGTDVIKVDFDEVEEEFEFQVTLQPGDNFRVAGFGDRDFLMQLENPDSTLSKTGAGDGLRLIDPNVLDSGKKPADADIENDEKYYSGVLTVWRYLYTEVDTMAAVKDNFISGTITGFTALGLETNNAPKYQLVLSENIYAKRPSKKGTEGLLNSFENGRILAGETLLHISENSANASGPDTVTVSAIGGPGGGEIDESIIGKKFKIVDDDYLNGMHKDGAKLPPVPMDRFAPAFEPAFILPRHDMLNNSVRTVPFLLNYFEDGDAYLKSLYAFDNKAYHQDEKFWVAYLLNAFQGVAKEDSDGTGTGAIAGQADGPGDSAMGAAIYQQSGAELEAQHKSAPGWRLMDAVPHEVGHLFGGDHADEGLMDERDAFKSGDFSDKTLDRIRSANYP